MTPLTREELAKIVSDDLMEGWHVNLGIGLPTSVADAIPAGREVILHSENGILGMGPRPAPGKEQPDFLINAGKQPVTLVEGGSYFDHATSFAMVRGGHLDVAVLGAFQVSEAGDLANWSLGDKQGVPGVGGAMDLAAGARRVFVMMEHITRNGRPKIVPECTLPLTARRAVHRIYTDHAVIDVVDSRLVVRRIFGTDFEGLQSITAAPLHEK